MSLPKNSLPAEEFPAMSLPKELLSTFHCQTKRNRIMQKIVLDVLLTDFTQWLACVYMAESVKVLPEEIQELIDVREWDLRTREGVQRFRELQAKSLPSIVMDGELIYESLIPGQEELCEEIRRHYQTGS